MAIRVYPAPKGRDMPMVGAKKASFKLSRDLAKFPVPESRLQQALMMQLSELAPSKEKEENIREFLDIRNFEYVDVPERFSQQVVLYRQFRILTRAVQVSGVALFISMSLLLVSTALGLAGMYLSLALALVYLYAFWLEAKVPILNPRYMALGIVAMLGLGATSLATLLPF